MAETTLREASNSRIMNDYFARRPGLDFDGRTNLVTKRNLESAWESMQNFEPSNNSFALYLLNRIGLTIFASHKQFHNPFSEFKQPGLAHGNAVQEIATGLLKAHSYDARDDGETVFAREVPDGKAVYHERNREEFYKVTTNRDQLMAAFMQEEGGLVKYVDQLTSALVSSDELDEFNYMTNLLREYHKHGGFHYMPAGSSITYPNDENGRAKSLLRAVRTLAKDMNFPNVHFNAGNMPTWASVDEIVILTSSENEALIDVEALAAAFNVDRMTIAQRVKTVPSYVWRKMFPGINAFVIADWFFRVWDQLTKFTEITNPQSLNTNLFLHRWQIISMSPFAPAVALTDELETITVYGEPTTIEVGTVQGVQIYPRLAGQSLDQIERGGTLALDATLTVGNLTDYPENTVGWELRGNNSVRTNLSAHGTLECAPDETSSVLTVRCYEDSDAPTVSGAEVQIPVVGPIRPVIENRDPDADPIVPIDPDPVDPEL